MARKSLTAATADLKATVEGTATAPEEQEMTQEEVNTYRELLDMQRQELDLENHGIFIALDAIRTLTPFLNIEGYDSPVVDVKKAASAKILEAIKQITFPVVEES